MDHQYKNPNQAQAVINNRNQTAPVTDSQDVQTMEYVDQQDVAGNDFVAEQIPAVAGPTSAGGAVSPWDVNLFSQAKPGMKDVEWARDSKSTHFPQSTTHTHIPPITTVSSTNNNMIVCVEESVIMLPLTPLLLRTPRPRPQRCSIHRQ